MAKKSKVYGCKPQRTRPVIAGKTVQSFNPENNPVYDNSRDRNIWRTDQGGTYRLRSRCSRGGFLSRCPNSGFERLFLAGFDELLPGEWEINFICDKHVAEMNRHV